LDDLDVGDLHRDKKTSLAKYGGRKIHFRPENLYQFHSTEPSISVLKISSSLMFPTFPLDIRGNDQSGNEGIVPMS
jgi:hypothetical protein